MVSGCCFEEPGKPGKCISWSSGGGGSADASPAWAKELRSEAANRSYRHAAVQSLKEGDRGGASATPDIKDRED